MRFSIRLKSAIICVVVVLLVSPVFASGPGEVSRHGKGYRFEHNGWVYIHIEGAPFERGEQHGYLAAPEIKKILISLKHLTYFDTGKKWAFFVDAAAKLWVKQISPEFIEEIKGIAAGATKAGVKVAWQEILAWNGHCELMDYWWPKAMTKYRYVRRVPARRDHCSSFIAAGAATAGGKIVMAHTSWDDFQWGQFSNLILDVVPAKGNRMFMQSVPGYIHSMSDFFLTGAGLIGTETTIGGFSMYAENEAPEFFRARKAMQYAGNLDEFVRIMNDRNNGGYANSWLLGDLNTGEIMRFEQGLKFQSVERKKDGYFIGFNAPFDPRIRNLECSDTGFTDIRVSQGARRVRLTQLMEQYQGKIDVEIAKKILADHYDVYLKKINPSSRTVEGHYELDALEYMSRPGRPTPFRPRGAVDGKVTDGDLAKQWKMWARWGNPSGMPFDAGKFLKEHAQWRHLEGYITDRPTRPWTTFSSGDR